MSITCSNIMHRFNDNILFRNLNVSIDKGESLAITGHNGSGKSTLLEIIAGLRAPTRGNVIYSIGHDEILRKSIMNYIGFISPKVNPYGELTGLENIHFVSKKDPGNLTSGIIIRLGLENHLNKQVKYYSTGMKQRLKFYLAIQDSPPIIVLDEPGSNLDEAGHNTIFSYLESVRDDKIIIIATNNMNEANFCSKRLDIGKSNTEEH